jgi:hypothetical protein
MELSDLMSLQCRINIETPPFVKPLSDGLLCIPDPYPAGAVMEARAVSRLASRARVRHVFLAVCNFTATCLSWWGNS